MPRHDVAGDPRLLDAVGGTLTPAYDCATALAARPGCSAIAMPPQLRALSSPWLIGMSAPVSDPIAAGVFGSAYSTYLSQWLDLIRNAMPHADVPLPDSADLVSRDSRLRRAPFHVNTDPVWELLTELIGEESTQWILSVLRTPV